MKIIKPGFEFITPINGSVILKRLEECGRVCYKSEGKITDDSAPKDVAMMLALLKVARIKTGVKGDSFVDLAGYAACAGEIATETPKVPPVNTCISCGAEIPEGRQVCPTCLKEASR